MSIVQLVIKASFDLKNEIEKQCLYLTTCDPFLQTMLETM